MNEIKTVPIQFGMCTLVGYFYKTLPIKNGAGNCFSLYDTDGTTHKIANFSIENLEGWMKQSGQTDIRVRCIPKSSTIWEIADERIPKEWYKTEYCTVCVPLRMLPREQRIRYLKNKTFHKSSDGTLLFTTELAVKTKDQIIYAPYTIKIS